MKTKYTTKKPSSIPKISMPPFTSSVSNSN